MTKYMPILTKRTILHSTDSYQSNEGSRWRLLLTRWRLLLTRWRLLLTWWRLLLNPKMVKWRKELFFFGRDSCE